MDEAIKVLEDHKVWLEEKYANARGLERAQLWDSILHVSYSIGVLEGNAQCRAAWFDRAYDRYSRQ